MSTLQTFGIPLGGGAGRGGLIQPKTKQKFRVRVSNFGPVSGGLELSQQVVSVNRPSFTQEEQAVHSYNSIAYYAGKGQWGDIELTLRDDVSNSVSKLVGHQIQKQMNFFDQTTPLAGSNYKFTMFIETLDGGNNTVLEQWICEGCFIKSSNYGEFGYEGAEAMTIQLSIRPDNCTQSGGLFPTTPDIGSGPMIG